MCAGDASANGKRSTLVYFKMARSFGRDEGLRGCQDCNRKPLLFPSL